MDLNLLTLARHDGQDLPDLPGLLVAAPPRRPARGRHPDRLVLFFILEGNAPLGHDQHEQLLRHLVQTYYQTPGSVTAALRSVAENLNNFLLERNLRMVSSGQQGNGLLALATLRGDQLYLAISGPLHAFQIQQGGARHLFNPDSSIRGLGVGRATPIQYAQVYLSATDTLILSYHPPAAWSEVTLSGAYGQDLHGLRRRLSSHPSPDFNSVLLQARPGPGQIHRLVSSSDPQPAGEEAPVRATGQAAIPLPSKMPPTAPPVEPGDRLAAEEIEPDPVVASSPLAAPPAMPPETPYPQPAASSEAQDLQSAPARAAGRPQVGAHPAAPTAQPRPSSRPAGTALATTGRALSSALGSLAQGIQTLAQRMLPGEGTLPSSVMAFFAIAVPLVVVTVATVVYFQRGRTTQFQAYYVQAVQAAEEAQAQSDPQERQRSWAKAIAYLDRAETYGSTSESKALRAKAQSVFDELEGIRRVNYVPAIAGSLPASFEIKRLVATESDLYVLDANSGQVARAVSTGQVYELDPGFQCGPGFPTGQVTGKIVDIAPLPKGNELNATIIALDDQGHVLQCRPGAQPVFNVLAPPPANWGGPVAFSLDLGNLYILDPAKNAVWVYWGSDFEAQPQFFFSEDVPPMQDVVDLAVDKYDLYLLHADGHLTLCTFSNLGVSPTRCSDPVPYADSRPGREGLILIPETPFVQIRTTQPPDPSLYLLDSQSQAIYHFSLRLLTFQRQLRSQNPLLAGRPATAFALRPDGRVIFLALGNRVFYAGMP